MVFTTILTPELRAEIAKQIMEMLGTGAGTPTSIAIRCRAHISLVRQVYDSIEADLKNTTRSM